MEEAEFTETPEAEVTEERDEWTIERAYKRNAKRGLKTAVKNIWKMIITLRALCSLSA